MSNSTTTHHPSNTQSGGSNQTLAHGMTETWVELDERPLLAEEDSDEGAPPHVDTTEQKSRLELEENAWDRWFGIIMGGILAAIIFSLLFITAFPSDWPLAAQIGLALSSGGLAILIESVMDGKALIEFSTQCRVFIYRQWRWLGFKIANLRNKLGKYSEQDINSNWWGAFIPALRFIFGVLEDKKFHTDWSDEKKAFDEDKFNLPGLVWNIFLFLCLTLNAAGLMALSGSAFGAFLGSKAGLPMSAGFWISAIPIFLMSLSFNCSLTIKTFAPLYVKKNAPKENYWKKIAPFVPKNWKLALGLLIGLAPVLAVGCYFALNLLIPGLGATLSIIISLMIAVAPALFVAPAKRSTGLALVFALFAGVITASINNIIGFSKLPADFIPAALGNALMIAAIVPAMVTQFFSTFNASDDYFSATSFQSFKARMKSNFSVLGKKTFWKFVWQSIKTFVTGGDDKSHSKQIVDQRREYLENLAKTRVLNWREAKELDMCQNHPNATQAFIQISKIIILMGRAIGIGIFTATCFATLFTVTGAAPGVGVVAGFAIAAAILDTANQTFQNRTFCFEQSAERHIEETNISHLTLLLEEALEIDSNTLLNSSTYEGFNSAVQQQTATKFAALNAENDPGHTDDFQALRSQLGIHLTSNEEKQIQIQTATEVAENTLAIKINRNNVVDNGTLTSIIEGQIKQLKNLLTIQIQKEYEMHITSAFLKACQGKTAERMNKELEHITYQVISENILQKKIALRLKQLKKCIDGVSINATDHSNVSEKFQQKWKKMSGISKFFWLKQHHNPGKNQQNEAEIQEQAFINQGLVDWRKEHIARQLKEFTLSLEQAKVDASEAKKSAKEKTKEAGYATFSPFISVLAFFCGNGKNADLPTRQRSNSVDSFGSSGNTSSNSLEGATQERQALLGDFDNESVAEDYKPSADSLLLDDQNGGNTNHNDSQQVDDLHTTWTPAKKGIAPFTRSSTFGRNGRASLFNREPPTRVLRVG